MRDVKREREGEEEEKEEEVVSSPESLPAPEEGVGD